MLLVNQTSPGHFELNYMWLPTWLGMNAERKRQVEEHICAVFVGKEATPEDLHREVIDHLCQQFPLIDGLSAYLHAVEGIVLCAEKESRACGPQG